MAESEIDLDGIDISEIRENVGDDAAERISELKGQLEKAQKSGGPEDISKTAATQISFGRALAAEADEDISFAYHDRPDGADEEENFVVVTNESYPGRREGWRIGIFMDMAHEMKDSPAGRFSWMRENLSIFQELSMECSRNSIGSVLEERGFDPDAAMEEFSA